MSVLEEQTQNAKKEFPYLIVKSKNELEITFPDFPEIQYLLIFKDDFPNSPPHILKNGEEFKSSLVEFWLSFVTISQICKNLMMHTIVKMNDSLSPTVVKSPQLDGLRTLKKTINELAKNPSYHSTPSSPKQLLLLDISLAENDGSDEYKAELNKLKLRYINMEINMKNFTREFKKLQSLKQAK